MKSCIPGTFSSFLLVSSLALSFFSTSLSLSLSFLWSGVFGDGWGDGCGSGGRSLKIEENKITVIEIIMMMKMKMI